MEALTPSFMQTYFKDAADLEKRRFVFEGTLKETNNKLASIKSAQAKSLKEKSQYQERLANLGGKYTAAADEQTKKIDDYRKSRDKFLPLRKKAKAGLILLGIVLGVLFILAVATGGETSPLFALFILLVYGEAGLAALFIVSKIKVNRATEFLNQVDKRDLDQEKLSENDLLIENIQTCTKQLIALQKSEESLLSVKAQLTENYTAIKKALAHLYGKGYIAPCYHNFSAMATFYHYLSTGRCLQITGPGGVIDTYERDCQAKLVYSTLIDIRDIALDNNALMHDIRDEAALANQKLSALSHSLNNIERNTANLARSTKEISNYCAECSDTLHSVYGRY